MDVFLASVACGAEQIRIEKKTALCIGAVCSGVLFFSLVCGKLIDGVVREKYAAYLCFAGLFLVGAYKLTEYGIRASFTYLCIVKEITIVELIKKSDEFSVELIQWLS